MIHRFIDYLPVVREPDVIYQIRRHTGGTSRMFALAGNLAAPVALSAGSEVDPSIAVIDEPWFNPTATEYAYAWTRVGGPSAKDEVRVAPTDDTTIHSVIATNPSGATVQTPTGGTDILGWSPDGQQVYYRGTNNNTDRHSEVRVVNRDGTGNTLLWSSTSILSPEWGFGHWINPAATLFGLWLDFDAGADQGLWTMETDGTNMTKIYAATDGSFPSDFYGWSPDGTRMLLMDANQSLSPRRQYIRVCDPDGTNVVTVYDRVTSGAGIEPEIRLSWGQRCWLPDGSAVVCAKQNYGTEPKFEVGVLAVDGSETFTPLSPSRRMYESMTGLEQNYGPNVWGQRIYFVEGALDGAQQLVSTLIDGTDYRVDHDMDTDAFWDDFAFNGWQERAL